MSQNSKKNSHRFLISLPETKQISYADLIENYYKDQGLESEDFLSEVSQSYCKNIQNLINRGETYGICSKDYKHKRNSSETDTDSQSVLSSFIDEDSEISSADSQIFQLALNEGFFVLPADEFFNKNELKRTRTGNFEIPSEVLVKILEIKEIYKEKKFKQIPKQASKILMDIQRMIENKGNEEIVFKELGKITGQGKNNIKQYVEKIKDNEEKKKILK